MFKKFTDTLSGTLDTVRSYGSSMGIGQAGQGGAPGDTTDGRPATSKLSLNLPTLGRGESTNDAVMASYQSGRGGRGPVLGRAVETNETRITEMHTLDDNIKGLGLEDISDYGQYMTLKNAGQLRNATEYEPLPTSERMNGNAPQLVRSNTDEIIDQQFKTLQGNLDDVLGETEQLDELAPVIPSKDDKKADEEKPKKKKKNKHIMRCIRCIQDNRVKGGCVDAEEMLEAAEDNLVLKKVLNIVFLVIGTLLFIAVFVVIIYTTVADKNKYAGTDRNDDTTRRPNNTAFVYEYEEPDTVEPPAWEKDLAELSPDNLNWLQRVKNSMDAMSLSADGSS